LARQFAQFISEIARSASGQEIEAISYMAQYEDEGVLRVAMVNPSEELNDTTVIGQFFQQAEVTDAIDGLLKENENGGGVLTMRSFAGGNTEPAHSFEYPYLPGGVFAAIRSAIRDLTELAGGKLDESLNDDQALFGTTDATGFLKFLEGYDAAQYIEKSNGNVAKEFNPQDSMKSLIEAAQGDKDWEAPMLALLSLCRLCAQYRVGNAEMVVEAYNQLVELFPEEPRVWFGMGDFMQAMGDNGRAADAFEKAHRFAPEEPAILSRLAIAQLNLGMPANAERNLRKAIDLEPEEKPSLDVLANVLNSTGRNHEVPALWKEQLESRPQDAMVHAKYAMSLINNGRKEEGLRAFDHGLETLEETTLLKRFYAPVLATEDDTDRAMDFYEDYLDENPNDVAAMVEYAQTLQKANREFEIPPVLKNILASNPDMDTKAQTQAWLIELEQPKRAEAVNQAASKAEKGDFDGAVRELKPLRQWLADYWKLWMVLASTQNQLGQYTDAEQSARRLLELFPSCEPGYVELNNALAAQNKFDEAFALMQVAFANMNQSLPIAISYGLAAKRVGRDDEARQLARNIREAVGEQAELNEVLAELER
jgi:tetratricopeptide (TPR) repeat protein